MVELFMTDAIASELFSLSLEKLRRAMENTYM